MKFLHIFRPLYTRKNHPGLKPTDELIRPEQKAREEALKREIDRVDHERDLTLRSIMRKIGELPIENSLSSMGQMIIPPKDPRKRQA